MDQETQASSVEPSLLSPRSIGARRPVRGAFLLFAALAFAAAALLGHPRHARAQDDTNAPPPPADGEWAGDATDALSEPPPDEPAPAPAPAPDSGDAYDKGYEDGKRAAQAEQPAGPAMSDFHGSLDQTGQWVSTPDYGNVWQPSVSYGWRPYTVGRWAWTIRGWTWVSDEPWGWATYHYGRWVQLGSVWAWIPGRVWGPAWVAWRWGGGYAGWAPLGPRGGVYWRDPTWWVLIEQRHFLEPVHRHYLQPDRVGVVFPQVHPIRPVQGTVRGPVARAVGAAAGRQIVPLRIEQVGTPGQTTSSTHVTGEAVRIFAPRTQPIVHPARPPERSGQPAPGVPAGQTQARPAWTPLHPDGTRPHPAPHESQPHAPPPHAAPLHTQPAPPGTAPAPAPGPAPGPRAGTPVHAEPLVPGTQPVHFGGVPVQGFNHPPAAPHPHPAEPPRAQPHAETHPAQPSPPPAKPHEAPKPKEKDK